MFIFDCIYFMLPAYVANMAPVLVKKHFTFLAQPIDGGVTFRSQPFLGKNKTWRGLIFAVVFGTLVFAFQKYIAFNSIIDYSSHSLLTGFLLSFGAIFGDLVESFFKRQIKINPGKPWYIFDQLDFVVMALLVSSITVNYNVKIFVSIIIISLTLTILANHLGFMLKIRKEKW